MTIIKSKWVLILCMLPFMGMSILKITFYTGLAWKAVPAVFGLALLIIQLKEDYIYHKNSFPLAKRNYLILAFLYSTNMLFSGLYNDNLTVGILYTYTFYTWVPLYIDSCTNKFKDFLIVMDILSIAVIVLSFFYAVVSPDIAYTNFADELCFVGVLGNKNSAQLTLIPVIIYLLFSIYFFKGKYKYFFGIMIALAVIFLYLSKSGTASIVTCVLLAYLVFYRMIKVSFKGLAWTYIVVYLFVVVFRLQEVLFYDLIVNGLNKDITLSNRTLIWDHVLKAMKHSLLIGYGPRNNIIWTAFPTVVETHNGLLEIFLAGGSISLIIFLSMLTVVGKELDKYKENQMAGIILFSLFIYSIIGLTECTFGYVKMLFWSLMIIGLNIGKIIKQSEEATK
ncbi:O-antigen ligase family protein [Cellulosilyticum ruminicola]|uniref:O-antigen ligase family protein n=1 Tax=Cellulosilyticum ruminicola TaxID=425254 RepID=UPI0006D02CD8|nr:O-antigen ligase family protein [Cellulosilyticum ruminicola]